MSFLDKFRSPVQQQQSPLTPEELDALQQYSNDPAYDMNSPLSAGLPSSGMYGQPTPAFNEKMAELAIGTHITIGGKEIKNLEELPTLFYFLTDNWRHLQLTNIKKSDQKYIEREIADIHMLAHQSRRKRICKLKQIQLFDTIYLFKSRSDLNRMTEREIWTLQTSQYQQQDIKRPKETSGGFFSSLLGGKNRGD